jgi:SET domain-containing protein
VIVPPKPFRVGRSATGLGLFATCRIDKGAVILEYRGRRIPHAEAEQREAGGNRYVFEINGRWSIDGSSRRNVGRYANHSCRPNAESDLATGRIILRAIRTILPGTEITYDYGRDYLELFFRRTGCRCEKCRERTKPTLGTRSRSGR